MTEQFIMERRYLKAVTPKTEAWYRDAFKAFAGALDSKQTINQRITELRQRGVQPVSVNTWIRVINAYFMWLHKEHGKERIKIPKLKEEQKILAVFSPEQISRVINWKPVRCNEARVWTMAVTALDCGLRIQELLYLTRQDVDFDNLVLRIHGKGNKQRLVPMSIQLRKLLYRYLAKHKHPVVFATRSGVAVTVRNAQRDFKIVCRKAGITGVRTSFHTLRHTFAVNYLKSGGNLYYLQRILGHSSITTTERYLRSLGIDDLKKVHDGLSLLSNGSRP